MLHNNSSPQSDGSSQHSSSLVPIQQNIHAEYYLTLGKTLYKNYLARSRQQDLDAAVQHFQKAVTMKPDLAEAYVHLASALWEQGTINLELAQYYCETSLKLDPSRAEANLYLGYFLQRSGFYEDAVEQFETAICKNPWRSARSRIALGHILLKQAVGMPQDKWQQVTTALQGIKHFSIGCMVLPFDKQTSLILGQALLADAQIYSVDYLAKGLKKIKADSLATKLYEWGHASLPREPFFLHVLGDEYFFERKDARQAIVYYKQAFELEPNNVSLLKKMGKAYANLDQSDEAKAMFAKVADMRTGDFDSLYNLALINIEEKAYIKALYYLKQAEQQRPRYPYVHSNMAYVMFKLDDMEGALEEYKLALEFGSEPEWLSTVSQTIANLYVHVYQDAEQAMEYLQQSVHYHPRNKDALAMLADLYFEAGYLEYSLRVYRAILELEPENADCYSNIGYILWQLDKNQEAIDAYLTALKYDESNHIAKNNLGVIYLDEMQNPEKALPLFEEALALHSEYTLASFNRGRALQGIGQMIEAAEAYGESLQLNQVNPELEDSEIQSYIEQLFE